MPFEKWHDLAVYFDRHEDKVPVLDLLENVDHDGNDVAAPFEVTFDAVLHFRSDHGYPLVQEI